MQTVKRTRRSALSSSDPVSSTGHRGKRVASSDNTRSRTNVRGHVPVLLHEVLECLALKPDDIVVDATLGGAGHAHAITKHLGPGGTFIGLDADGAALGRAEKALSSVAPKVHLAQANFRTIHAVLERFGVTQITKGLFDLGWSGFQLESGRGFSFLTDEPLLMTYADAIDESTVTAEVIVNSWGEESIALVLTGWGEERYARRIAKAIVEARKKHRITTARELADIVKAAVPRGYAHGRVHPATRTFQALRIAVNDELGALKEGISAAWKACAVGGRIAVISFHSVEDREVKHLFREWERKGEALRITRSPIVPTREEIRANPRARSAKLRVIEKIDSI